MYRSAGLGGSPDGFTPEDMAACEKWFLTAFEVGDPTFLLIAHLLNGYRLVIATLTQHGCLVSTLALWKTRFR
jgi:hypothetical protein